MAVARGQVLAFAGWAGIAPDQPRASWGPPSTAGRGLAKRLPRLVG